MDEARSQPDTAADEQGIPRWVKGFVIVGVVVLLVAVVLLVGGDHGPGRHELGAGPSAVGAAPE